MIKNVIIRPRVAPQVVRMVNSMKCFICGQVISGIGVPITTSITAHSKIPLPHKIWHLVGDGFVVCVNEEDEICLKCTTLVNQLDKFETEAEKVKKQLVNFLKIKYKVDVDANTAVSSSSASASPEKAVVPTLGTKRKIESLSPGTVPSYIVSTKRVKTEPLKCKFCNVEAENQAELNTHIRNGCRTVVFRCSICPTTFNEQSRLRKHYEDCHKNRYKCNVCNDAFKDEYMLKAHSCKPRKFLCGPIVPNCAYRTNSVTDFEAHLKTHLNIKRLVFKCGVCGQRFDDKRMLTAHHLQQHAKSKDPTTPQKIATQSRLYKCGTCGKVFRNPDELKRHLPEHTLVRDGKRAVVISEPSREMRIPSKTYSRIVTVQKNQPKIEFLTCQKCQLTFLNDKTYQLHVKTHHAENANDSHQADVNDGTQQPHSTDDLETIFEKLHSGNSIKKEINEEQTKPIQQTFFVKQEAIPDVKPQATESQSIQLIQEPQHEHQEPEDMEVEPQEVLAHSQNNLEATATDEETIDNTNVEQAHDAIEGTIMDPNLNKIYAYKCPGCDELYESINDIQEHMLAHGHGDINSEVQILEYEKAPEDENLINFQQDCQVKILSEDGTPIKYINIDESQAGEFLDANGSQIKLLAIDNDKGDESGSLVATTLNQQVFIQTSDGIIATSKILDDASGLSGGNQIYIQTPDGIYATSASIQESSPAIEHDEHQTVEMITHENTNESVEEAELNASGEETSNEVRNDTAQGLIKLHHTDGEVVPLESAAAIVSGASVVFTTNGTEVTSKIVGNPVDVIKTSQSNAIQELFRSVAADNSETIFEVSETITKSADEQNETTVVEEFNNGGAVVAEESVEEKLG